MTRPPRSCSIILFWMLLLLGSVEIVGCETQPSKEAIGTGIGTVVGGIIGAQIGGGRGQTAAMIGGMVLGGVVGNAIGKRMDENDRKRMSQALETNAPGQASSWKSETTGTNYTITPAESFVRDGRPCREFVQEAIIDGQPRKISGTACKRTDGTTWEET